MADPQLQTGFSSADFTPPPQGTPLSDPRWQDWFGKVYDTLLSNGASFPKITMQGKHKKYTISTEQLDQDDVISVNCGWYSNWTTNSGNISYGVASNVRRSYGQSLTVASQFTAWANQGLIGTILFGSNLAAVGEIGSDCSLVGLEINSATKESSSTSAKIGIDFVTSNIGAPSGFGANRYNYYSYAMRISATSRSALGEFSGWNVALMFAPGGMDISTALVWSAVRAYTIGDIVSSGGLLYICIVGNTNNVPPNATYWVLRSVAGGYGITNYAVGIDFSGLTSTDLARMWSAIRLTSLLPIHWDSAGTIATYYDAPNDRHVISSKYNGAIPVRWMEIECSTGNWRYGGGLTAPGAGPPVAALGNIGSIGGQGPGPLVAAQTGWFGIKDNVGNWFWLPYWR